MSLLNATAVDRWDAAASLAFHCTLPAGAAHTAGAGATSTAVIANGVSSAIAAHTASAGTTDTVITGGMHFTTRESAAIAAGAGAMYSTTRAGTAIAAGAGVMYSTPGAGAVVTARAVALYSSTVTSAAITATAVRCTPTSARVLQLLEELVRCPQPPTQEIAAGVEKIKCTTSTGASNIAKAGKRTPNVPPTAPSCERSDDRPELFNVLLKTKMKIALSSLVERCTSSVEVPSHVVATTVNTTTSLSTPHPLRLSHLADVRYPKIPTSAWLTNCSTN